MITNLYCFTKPIVLHVRGVIHIKSWAPEQIRSPVGLNTDCDFPPNVQHDMIQHVIPISCCIIGVVKRRRLCGVTCLRFCLGKVVPCRVVPYFYDHQLHKTIKTHTYNYKILSKSRSCTL